MQHFNQRRASNRSRAITPEVLYAGINNPELLARAFILYGDNRTEFGERSNRRRLELQVRPHF
ncbi:MAG: hypothetical protein AB7E73_05800 [Burkholderiales bacterium]